MASVAGVRTNQLVGYGLVIGLAKTGDGSVNLTKQSIASMISQFGVIANIADINAKMLLMLWSRLHYLHLQNQEQQSMLQFHHLARANL